MSTFSLWKLMSAFLESPWIIFRDHSRNSGECVIGLMCRILKQQTTLKTSRCQCQSPLPAQTGPVVVLVVVQAWRVMVVFHQQQQQLDLAGSLTPDSASLQHVSLSLQLPNNQMCLSCLGFCAKSARVCDEASEETVLDVGL